mmetsp:Transcript_7869/g.7930  ORF Transcript_7869/g.7930 Transcript_7869/m.7930 type:complete len:97 (+) Transcript_7869:115-405(+)
MWYEREKRLGKIFKSKTPADTFNEKAANIRLTATTKREADESLVLKAVIAADTIGDAESRLERISVARKAAAIARLEMATRKASSTEEEKKCVKIN